MEKFTLKPQTKELLLGNGETGTHFDVLSCPGATTQEKNLGSLFMVSHIKSTDEDLSYLVSLASSLAKREYYSEQSLTEQDPKSAFNRTLRKLNEVLEEFFQNKKFHLNIGLVSISGNNIYISRLGKFKVSLARNGQLIDVLNNIEFFDKDTEGEKQFSNIISGKLQSGDKIFAYYPLRSIVSREKQLGTVFTETGQEEFSQKLVQLAANAKSFSCCGVHIQMEQIKEIPVQSPYRYPARATASMNGPNRPLENSVLSPVAQEAGIKPQTLIAAKKKQEEESDTEPSEEESSKSAGPTEAKLYIIPAELSVGRRSHPLSAVVKYASKLKNLGRLNPKTRVRIFLSIAAVIIIPLLVLVGVKTFGSPSEVKKAINSSRENLRLAQSYLSQNNAKEARQLLYRTLAAISAVGENKKTENIKSEANQTLAVIDKTSDQKPVQFADLNQGPDGSQTKATLIAHFADGVVVATENNSLAAVDQNGITEIAKFTFTANYLFVSTDHLATYDGQRQIWSFDLKGEKSATYTLKEPPQAIDAVVYENNLYTLTVDSIYKYNDLVTGGGIAGNKWASGLSDNTAITVDGNVYILANTGILGIYFKGAKTGELDFQISPVPDSRIFTFKDHAFLYLTDKTNARVYVFDKATGSLKTSYDFSSAGAITDISVSPNGFVWVLSSDNKIWTIR